MIPYELTAKWGPRATSLEEDANSLAQFMERLATLGEPFVEWFVNEVPALPLTRPSGPERMARLVEHLSKNVERWEHADKQYSARQALLTNARARRYAVDIEAKTGISTPPTTIWFANYVVLRFRAPQASGVLADPGGAERLFQLVIEHFAPSWACLSSGDVPEASVTDQMVGKPRVGWLTYIVPMIPGKTAPAGHERQPLGEGMLFRSQRPWFDPRRSEDVASAENLKRGLEASGWLEQRAHDA